MAEAGFNSITDVTLKIKTEFKVRNRRVYLPNATPAEYHALCELLHIIAQDPVGSLEILRTAPVTTTDHV
ncbi:hypothetical protein SAMN06269173_11145 [Hymenobacter mucosus]|uniref:Uncharacterized protein n=1 Tax=Hymenobacter mucosus TaxID=1411120 RepID=A0A239A895_9BACT|nr:hypothetical protein SAMN06269173_11145 [Hymenobacter mucosus]